MDIGDMKLNQITKMLKEESPKESTFSKEEVRIAYQECCENIRDCFDSLFRIINVAGVIIGMAFAYSAFRGGGNGSEGGYGAMVDTALFMISVVAICAVLFLCLNRGTLAVLYHRYATYLEKVLGKMPSHENEESLVHFHNLYSSISTMNFKKLKGSTWSRDYMRAGCIALVLISMVCLGMVIMQGIALDTTYQVYNRWWIGISILLIAGTAIYVLYFGFKVTQNSEEMFAYAWKEGKEKQQRRKPNCENVAVECDNKKSRISYYILPRPNDVAKAGFTAFGVVFGAYLLSDEVPLSQLLTYVAVIVFVFEFLVYQGRYIWNDIRGIDEDRKHKEKGVRARLSVSENDEEAKEEAKAVVAQATGVILLRLLLAGIIIPILFVSYDMSWVALTFGSVAIFGLGAIYEVVRGKGSGIGVITLVGIGYPLRFLIGAWAIYSTNYSSFPSFDGGLLLMLLLCLYLYIFGQAFVSLNWVLEAYHIVRDTYEWIPLVRQSEDEKISIDPEPLLELKPHLKLLLLNLEKWLSKQNITKTYYERNILRERGPIFTFWNITFLLGMLCSFVIYYVLILIYEIETTSSTFIGIILLLQFILALIAWLYNFKKSGRKWLIAPFIITGGLLFITYLNYVPWFALIALIILLLFNPMFYCNYRDENYVSMMKFSQNIKVGVMISLIGLKRVLRKGFYGKKTIEFLERLKESKERELDEKRFLKYELQHMEFPSRVAKYLAERIWLFSEDGNGIDDEKLESKSDRELYKEAEEAIQKIWRWISLEKLNKHYYFDKSNLIIWPSPSVEEFIKQRSKKPQKKKEQLLLLNNFYPDEFKKNIYEIDYKMMYQKEYRGILFDIDNTLVPPDAPADEELLRLFESLHEMGFSCCFVSNNKEERVKSFSEKVGIPYIHNANKPLTKGLREGVEMVNEKPSKVFLVGDQIFTDVWGAKNAGIYCVLVRPLTHREDIGTSMRRVLEKIVLFFYNRKK